MEKFEWVKSSYSGGGENCVEVANGGVHVRDTKNRAAILTIEPSAWRAFLKSVHDSAPEKTLGP